MPLALVVAPSDPRAGDAASRRADLAWLRGQLARHGFDIVIVSGGSDPRAAIEKAAPTINPGDSVLVHVSGRLVGGDELAFGDERSVALSALPDAFGARAPAHLAFVAELTAEGDGARARSGDAAQALSTSELRHEVVVAVRASEGGAARPPSRFKWTRAALGAPELAADGQSMEALVAALLRAASNDASTFVACARAEKSLLAGGGARPPSELAPTAPDSSGREPEIPAAEDPLESATAARDWRRVAELRLERLDPTSDAKAQVHELVAIARLLQTELADPEGALAVLERARSLEPTRQSLLRALRRGYEAHGRWGSALEVLESLAALAEGGTARAGYRLGQARIAAEHFADEGRARAFVHEALLADPQHVEAIEFASQLDRMSQADGPSADAEPSKAPSASGVSAARQAEEPYASAFVAFAEQGHVDGSFLAALALEELGLAQEEHRAVLERGRTVGPVRARATLDAWAWERLRAPGYDELLAAVFEAIESAAAGAKLDELREAKGLPSLDRAQRLAESSTASVVRSFQWAARFLGVPCPALYAVDEAAGIVSIPAAEPATVLGPNVLSGPTAKDLAFLAGRHLTYLRPEYHVLLSCPARDDLTTLLLAAVQAAGSGSSNSSPAVRSLRARIERRLAASQRAALREAVRRLDERGGQAKIGAWMRSAELTAARAGLLLCGDLAAAARIVRGESRDVAELSSEERREDLVAFCASEEHIALRARFVAASAESLMPHAMTANQRTAAQ